MTTHDTGAGLHGPTFWVTAMLVLVYVGVPVLLVGAAVWWATRRARRDAPAGLVRRARTARLGGLAVGFIAGFLALWLGQGQLAPATVGVGYLFGLLVAELLGAPQPAGPLRVAPLQTRYVRSYIPRWSIPVLLGLGVLALAVPLVLAFLPTVHYGPWSPDGLGAQFTQPGGTLRWPAAACVPPAALAMLALASGGIALRRVVLLPPVTVEQPGLDEGARRNSAHAVIAAVLAIELFVLAAQAILASDGVAVPPWVGGHAYLISRILVWCGIGLYIAAVLVWCLVGWWKRLVVEPPAAEPSGPAMA